MTNDPKLKPILIEEINALQNPYPEKIFKGKECEFYRQIYDNAKLDAIKAVEYVFEELEASQKIDVGEIEIFLQQFSHLGTCAFEKGCHENTDLAKALADYINKWRPRFMRSPMTRWTWPRSCS